MKTHLLLVSTLMLGAVATPALAHPRMGERMMRARIEAHVDDALDAINANPQQRVAVRSAVEQLGKELHDHRAERFSRLADAVQLFAADKLDAQRVAELRGYQDREAERLSDAVVQAVYDVHAALTPAQRKQLVDYVQREMPQGGAGWRQKWMVNMVDDRLDDVLDQLKATPEQRKKLGALKDGIVGSWLAGKDERRSLLQSALTLFGSDTLDKKRVAELRTTYLQRHKALADRVEAAVREVHATLTPEQRRAAVELAKLHHRKRG